MAEDSIVNLGSLYGAIPQLIACSIRPICMSGYIVMASDEERHHSTWTLIPVFVLNQRRSDGVAVSCLYCNLEAARKYLRC